jgi:hypothetical protein
MTLANLAQERGAVPVLFMTWGYANGDKSSHPDIYPDYLTMQVETSYMVSRPIAGIRGMMYVQKPQMNVFFG